jgi:hypothetical protein
MENKIEMILSKIGDIEERIYNEFSDDEIESLMDYSEVIDSIKLRYKDNENELYNALKRHLSNLKSTFNLA